MSKVFERQNGEIRLTDKTLATKEFKAVYEQEERPMDCFNYIDLYVNPTSQYYEYEEQEKLKAVGRQAFDDEDYSPSELVKEAMIEYNEILTKGYYAFRMYKSTLRAAEELREHLETVDLKAVDDKGKPIYKAKDIDNLISKSVERVRKIKELKEIMFKEIETDTRTQGGTQINEFEIPD